MDVQIAKQPAKAEVLIFAQMLIAEEYHQILGERAVDLVESTIAERLRQIDPANLTADNRGQFVDGDRVVSRRFIG
jgi:hypothetical protein